MEKKILKWLATGETGLSSMTIAYKMTGNDFDSKMAPSDPDDLKRCLKLINEIPEIRPRLHEMAEVSEEWAKLVKRWDEVEQCFMDEVGEWLYSEYSNKRATKTYDLMKKIYSE